MFISDSDREKLQKAWDELCDEIFKIPEAMLGMLPLFIWLMLFWTVLKGAAMV